MKSFDQMSFFSELMKNEEIIKFLLDTAPIGIAILDSQGYYIKVNHNFARSIGYAVEEVAGMHTSDITCPLFLVSDAQKYAKIVNGELKSLSIRKQYFKRNGETLDARVDVFSFYSEETHALKFMGFYRNSLPFYKKYLPMIHSDLQPLVEKNPSPGILIASHDGKILFGSRFAANRLGYSEMEIDDISLMEIMDFNQARMLICLIQSNTSCKVLECELKFFHRGRGNICIFSQVYVDDTNFFRHGRMLVIILKDESGVSGFHKQNDRTLWEKELLLEVQKIKDSIQSCCKVNDREEVAKSDIQLSDYDLTAREKEVLSCLLERKSTKEIAYELELAEITIRKHFTSLYRKFEVSCREDLLLLLHGKNIA